MIRKITYRLDNEQIGIAAALLAAAAVVLSFTASNTPELRYCVPVGLGLGAFAVFVMAYSMAEFPVPYAAAALFGAFGYAYGDVHAGFGNLHAGTAWYALGAFLLAFRLVGEIAGWDMADSYYMCSTRTVLASSLAVTGFVPLTYGTGDLPLLFVIIYLAVTGWWVYGERRIVTYKKLPWAAYIATIVLAAVGLTIIYPIGSGIAAAIGGLAVVFIVVYLFHLLEDAAREAAQASA